MRVRSPEGLGSPLVPPDAYDEPYFLHVCGGSSEWRESDGRSAAGIYHALVQRASIADGQVVVDVGTGRGEMLVLAVRNGAAHALGVDYSADAVRLARRTVEAAALHERCTVLRGDARCLPIVTGSVHLVTMLDVVEHLAPREFADALAEAFRVLVPGGRLLLHTFPTRTVYEVTYRLQRLLLPWRLLAWPADPRNDAERRMHVNEQTLRTMRTALRHAGFTDVRAQLGDWVYADFVPARARATYRRLARFRMTAPLGIANIVAEATRP